MNQPDQYDDFDAEDFKKLLAAILKQAIEDYVKLQHPKARSKKYLQEAFESAVGLIFDPEYRLAGVQNELGEETSLDDLVTHILNGATADPEELQQYVVDQAKRFWERKKLHVIDIPETLIMDGAVYEVVQSEQEPWVDHDDHTIYCDKQTPSRANEETFVVLATEVMTKQASIPCKDPAKLGKAFYRLLRMNNSFETPEE